MDIAKYETQSDNENQIFTFISNGIYDTIKVIKYQSIESQLTLANGSKFEIFNLGFGDKINGEFDFDDSINSNNGDAYKVFNTVLHSIPLFFSKNLGSCLIVSGSDIRRTRLYNMYVTRNYETLTHDYAFYGIKRNILAEFVNGQLYNSIVIVPKN